MLRFPALSPSRFRFAVFAIEERVAIQLLLLVLKKPSYRDHICMGALFRTGGINPPSAKAPVRSQRRLGKLAPALFTSSVLLAVASGRSPVVGALRFAHRACSSRSYGSAAPRLFVAQHSTKSKGIQSA